MTTQVNVAEAKARLSDLLDRAAGGEDIVIAKNGRPRARLVAVPARARRQFGQWRGQVVFHPDWDDDLTGDFEDL